MGVPVGTLLLLALLVFLFYGKRIAKTFQLRKQESQAFLSHDWGQGSVNHALVKKINERLMDLDVVTWFDGDRLIGNIHGTIESALGLTKIALVFITRNYVDKVNSDNINDNCRLEFLAALKLKRNMIPIIMERDMLDANFHPTTALWGDKELYAELHDALYVTMFDHTDEGLAQGCEQLEIAIQKVICQLKDTVIEEPDPSLKL